LKTKLASAFLLLLSAAWSQRISVPLDGTWQIEDGVSSTAPPRAFGHQAPVPGLANLASPAFPDVDRFVSHELINHPITRPENLPAQAATAAVGYPEQARNYFWYRKVFRLPARKQVAILKVNKAQFGTAVWLNGFKLGEHEGCFSAGYFNLMPFLRWNDENEVVIRVGAHPAAMNSAVPAGTDFEKLRWTPGIYDSVSLILADNPVITSVQVAPRIASSSILVETELHNYGGAVSVNLHQRVRAWKGTAWLAESSLPIALKPGETKTVRQTLQVPAARLWSPEDPFLYVLESGSGGDSLTTRFGMREFHFETATRRAYLNGRLYYLRGSNITLHRFFEDPQCKALPWDENWVRKLLVEIPRRMHWNSFRLCIGPVPDRWLEIADEAGLLIQNEFFIWTGGQGWVNWHKEWDATTLIGQFTEWMRDNWNHASLVIWDTSNETLAPVLGEKVILAVRKLDLSDRPWENGSSGKGYNRPAGPDDPEEFHGYLFGDPAFRPTDLESLPGAPPPEVTHAAILNEYGSLWLTRDGQPTSLTGEIYRRLLPPEATPRERFETYAYYVAGLTEFWRAHRQFAAVLHFVYLTGNRPDAYTGDVIQDLKTLRLVPNFEDWVGEAFKPLGVYLNFWQPKLAAGEEREYTLMMVNDEPRQASGKLVLSYSAGAGEQTTSTETAFVVAGLGQATYRLKLRAPEAPGRYLLTAAAGNEGARTLSRRWVKIQ
jgi:beta-galactosidase